jgi:hypothetical protein
VDAALIGTAALPAGATTTYAGVDLQNGVSAQLGTANNGASAGFVGVNKDDFAPLVEFELDVPALTSTQVPNGDTITFAVVNSNSATFASGNVTLIPDLLTITGTGSAIAAQTPIRFRVPVAELRYLGVSATGVSGIAASGSNFTLTPKF